MGGWLGVCMVGMRADCGQSAGPKRGEFEFDGGAWYFCAPLSESAAGNSFELAKLCADGLILISEDKSFQPQVEAASIMVSVKEAPGKDWRVLSVLTTVCPGGHAAMAKKISGQGFSLPAVKASSNEPVASQYDFCGPLYDVACGRACVAWELSQIQGSAGDSGLHSEALRI